MDTRDSLVSAARDALAHFGGDLSLERRFSGGDSLSARARDALDAGGAVFEENGQWFCTWNGTQYGPFPDRARAMERRMMASGGRDSLADLVDRARGGIREQVGDSIFDGINDEQGRRKVAAALGISFKKLGKSLADLESAMIAQGSMGSKYMESAKAGYDLDRTNPGVVRSAFGFKK